MDNLISFCFRGGNDHVLDNNHTSNVPSAPRGSRQSSNPSPSLLTTMSTFVQKVDEMNETILVPCRLMDIEYKEGHMDLYTFYNTLNSVKTSLMCGRRVESNEETHSAHIHGQTPPPSAQTQITHRKGHTRTPSTVSENSSVCGSDIDFQHLDSDSGVEEEYSQQLSDNFQLHLNGLSKCLKELSVIADVITTRYTQDINASVR